jgi:hypothetical protein
MWQFEREVKAAWSRVDEHLSSLERPLSTQWKEDSTALAERHRARRVSDLLTNRDMFPSIPLIWWMGEALGVEDHQVMADLSEGAFYGYLYFRLQDDVMDEQARNTGGLLVANVCIERFHEIYRRHFALDSNFWPLWRQLIQTYSATTLWELRRRFDTRRIYTSNDLERLGDKFIPAAAPPVAVACLAGREDVTGEVVELVKCLGRGLQLVNDHKGIAHDFRTRNYTAVISEILMGVDQDRAAEEAAFPQKTLTTEALSKNLFRSRLYFKRACDIAQQLGSSHASRYVEEHLCYLADELERVAGMRKKALALRDADEAASSLGTKEACR